MTSWDDAEFYTRYKNDTNFKQIRVPYSDEFMVGITQNLSLFRFSAKYIHRRGKDEVRRMCQNPDGTISTNSAYCRAVLAKMAAQFVYTNEGRSTTNVISAVLQNIAPISFGEVDNFILLAFDWTDTRRNYEDYSVDITANELNNEMIWYGGKVIALADKPASNFARPYSVKISTTTTFPLGRTKWLLNNLFTWKSAYYAMASVSWERLNEIKAAHPEITAALEKYRVPYSFSWDMRIGFEIDTDDDTALYANLDIINVLNRKNEIVESAEYDASGVTATPTYELGRQFWIQVGYRF